MSDCYTRHVACTEATCRNLTCCLVFYLSIHCEHTDFVDAVHIEVKVPCAACAAGAGRPGGAGQGAAKTLDVRIALDEGGAAITPRLFYTTAVGSAYEMTADDSAE